ncbi:MAG: acyl-CoA reductase [Promethearchaeota archaeon]
MEKEITFPAFVFRPVYKERTNTTVIKRRDDILKLHYPVFNKEEVLDIAEKLSMRRRRAHDRPIDDVIDIMHQVGDLWSNPSYDLRKEALEVISITTGQSKNLCALELDGNLQMWNRRIIEAYLNKELGGKQFLEDWVTQGSIQLHAQPQGVLYHSIAGNAYSVGMMSLYYGMMTKNVNMLKLASEEPYFTVKLAESIADIDRKLAKELAILYWPGRDSEIFDALFNSGYINCIIAWGGIRSIQDIKRRAYKYGIKVVVHGPKLSYSILSDDIFKSEEVMRDAAKKLAKDIALWNQKACVSPRVIYIKEKPITKDSLSINKSNLKGNSKSKSKEREKIKLSKKIKENRSDIVIKSLSNQKENNQGDNISTSIHKEKSDALEEIVDKMMYDQEVPLDQMGRDMSVLMKRTATILRNEITEMSPLGFAKVLAEEMEKARFYFPRSPMTEKEKELMNMRRQYFYKKYVQKNNGTLLLPPDKDTDWTVAYTRTPPTLKEIQNTFDRFIIVTRISNIEYLIHFMRTRHILDFLQTISIYGSDNFVKEVAEEFSQLGAARFPRLGEHNLLQIGAPWDGHFILHELVHWAAIGFPPKGTKVEEIKVYIEGDLEE